jgi:hypothetical protein
LDCHLKSFRFFGQATPSGAAGKLWNDDLAARHGLKRCRCGSMFSRRDPQFRRVDALNVTFRSYIFAAANSSGPDAQDVNARSENR